MKTLADTLDSLNISLPSKAALIKYALGDRLIFRYALPISSVFDRYCLLFIMNLMLAFLINVPFMSLNTT